jgi:photosystem II stability/assembly factor-like uncharacterized protein
MRKLLVVLVAAGLLVLALSGTAAAGPPALTGLTAALPGTTSSAPTWVALGDLAGPTVSAVGPASAPNDIDTAVVIYGAGFVTDASTGAAPAASLGSTALTNVTLVDSGTLTATVPWGMNPGVYTLSVVNPDGTSGSLTAAFTVTQGIGHWNGGNLFGGEVRQILMKPGDPSTLYASAYGIVGLFRSQDAGEHWTYVSAAVAINNGKFAIDPQGWLYGYSYDGLFRSKDEGVTWTKLMPNTWPQPDGRAIDHGQVYCSPYNSQVLFFSSYDEPLEGYAAGGAQGLLESTDGGASWQIVADLEGKSVMDVAFDPTDASRMALVTRDAQVYQSTDEGGTWSAAPAQPGLASVGFRGVIAYNRYRSGEVWIASMSPNAVYKSTAADLSGWQNVSAADGSGAWDVTFTGADSVWITGHRSSDGGTSWTSFGPQTSDGQLTFVNPNDGQVAYLGDDTYGVLKTTDGCQTWQVKNQGLAGMVCSSLAVSHADPLRVYATFGDNAGIYRSTDGATNWTYIPIPGSIHVGRVCEDPFDSQRVYVVSDTNFYTSPDGGATWSDLGWNASPPSPSGMLSALQPDPFKQGHLLVAVNTGAYLTGPGYLYSSNDSGASWQAVALPQAVDRISAIAFDPKTAGLVYLATDGTGVYRSTNDGSTWQRLDDRQQTGMQHAGFLAIATHPQQTVLVGTGSQFAYRSVDHGATWQKAKDTPGGVSSSLYADGDSTRLYDATGTGLYLSSNGGDSWTRAAGDLGKLQILGLDYGVAGDHTILYAATSGGAAGAATGVVARASRAALATTSSLVDAGVYRYVQVPAATLTLKLSGLRSGALKHGRRVTAKGTVRPRSLVGRKVTLSVQRKRGHKWVTVKTVRRTIRAKGAYSWAYRPSKRAAYRLRAAVAKTVKTAAARTKWRTFKVK